MAITDYLTAAALNTQISGINVAENCPPSAINDAIRQLMADIAVGLQSGGFVPTGTILAFAGLVAPTGFLACDGAAVSRAAYPRLFAAIGTSWGVGDGFSTFNLPDLRGRAVIGSGQGTGLSARALASRGGEEAHALSAGELAPHAHNFSGTTGDDTPDHTHGYNGIAQGFLQSNTNGPNPGGAVQSTSGASTRHRHPFSGTTDTGTGLAGAPHNTMPPFAVAGYVIKT